MAKKRDVYAWKVEINHGGVMGVTHKIIEATSWDLNNETIWFRNVVNGKERMTHLLNMANFVSMERVTDQPKP